MYFRVAADLKPRLEAVVRRKRVTSSLIYYVPCVAIFGVLAVLYLITRGHGFVLLLVRAFDSRFSEAQVVAGLAIAVLVIVALVIALFLRGIIRDRLFEEHLFCGACNAVDKDDDGVCPFCGDQLSRRESFFTTQFDDEIQIAQRFGLLDANEA